jgi:hypothetical protein
MPDKKWREFELLVARIEQWLGPQGAKVKSPDRIRDRSSGELREVDASIRFRAGSAPILVTIECRDWVKTPDVTWIEQIATKRDDIGADWTIAVSSSGFTKSAEKKAEHHGIELRRTRDITHDVAAQWAHNLSITFSFLHWNIVSLDLRAAGVEPGGEPRGGFPADIADAFQANPSDTRIGYERCSGKPLSIRAMVDSARVNLPEFTADLKTGEPPVRKALTIGFPVGSFVFFTDQGERHLEEMRLVVDVWLTKRSPPPPAVRRYESAEGEVLFEVAHTELEVEPGRKLTMLCSQTPPADLPSSDGDASPEAKSHDGSPGVQSRG